MSKKKSLQEHLERMKYVSRYQINETPKYKSLVGDSEFDSLPEYLMKEADEEVPATGATDTSLSQEPQPEPAAAPEQPEADAAPETDVDVNKNVEISTQPNPEEIDQTPMPEPEQTPEKKVMELQLDALKKMSYKIEDLGNAIDALNKRMEVYSSEVDEVREPSDMEKFDNRKLDSHPYYYNLNDLWDNNNFKSRMDQFSKGYVKTEDGYVADFDDLPKLAPHEVKASFDM